MIARYYVYILYDWQGTPRYVGAGSANRWLYHERREDPYNQEKNRFIKETFEKIGRLPKVKYLQNLTREQSFEEETKLINIIGRYPDGPLVNLTDGGQGPNGSDKIGKYPKSEEHRAKISATLMGHTESDETREKKRLASLGRTQSNETREKKRLANIGKKRSPEQLERIRAALAIRKKPTMTDELRASYGNTSRGSIWITDGNSCRRMPTSESIPEGWYRGRN
jgi:hypothetical protein